MERKQKQILGFNVDLFSLEDALSYVKELMHNSKSAQIVTINPEMIEMADNNKDFASILKNAELVIPDGIGIKIALKLKGINQEQIPGIEFAKELIRICEQNQYPIALIGAKEDVLEKTITNLKEEFPKLDVTYSHDGFFDEAEENKIISSMVFKNPKLVLVATGAPKQEIFINKYKNFLNNSVFIGVGGSFDVWSGEVQRAPMAFRKIGCEWLYRVLKQPSRFRRIFPTLPLFLLKVLFDSEQV